MRLALVASVLLSLVWSPLGAQRAPEAWPLGCGAHQEEASLAVPELHAAPGPRPGCGSGPPEAAGSILRERDHLAGAGYGLAAGALVGGLGFASLTVIANAEDEGRGYWPLALMVGSAVGGAAGLIVGAVVGAPAARDRHARLSAAPGGTGEWRLGLSLAWPGPRPRPGGAR